MHLLVPLVPPAGMISGRSAISVLALNPSLAGSTWGAQPFSGVLSHTACTPPKTFTPADQSNPIDISGLAGATALSYWPGRDLERPGCARQSAQDSLSRSAPSYMLGKAVDLSELQVPDLASVT